MFKVLLFRKTLLKMLAYFVFFTFTPSPSLSIWGNMGDDSNGECGAPTYYRFNASTNGNSIFWYSFDFNMVHFVMLSSEHNYSANAPGRVWLESDLKNVDRTETPWLIVNIHRPLYESEDYADDTMVSNHLVTILESTLMDRRS